MLVTIAQVALLIVIAQASDALVRWLHLPIPGSIAGIILLFLLLQFHIIRLEWVERGSKFLVAEMLLFFIPATVGIINYKSLVIDSGLSITLTIIGSTFAVMLCAGLIGQWITGRKEKAAS
ncbi:CidA/LrgA family protein [Paenibacillus spongiae]|uniref:CidA/LrgA family holin-like protein n=1 Tax=Paenibacillus spongiae TaxID=2909671 RepID=A0ABY5SIX2_9BACL|nr:CidA/LrgA family holin-like protein [Paenibacillus spongiae]UVI33694.1 CidA/LrgA family holin-like protein [Paenibacillus spongiae]